MKLLAQAYWLALPVALAGILHMVVVKKDLLAALKRPLDGGRTLGGKPIFGPNKTWRGVFFMIVASGVLGLLQGVAAAEWGHREGLSPFGAPAEYLAVNLVLGLGYALGELPNSFLKRRIAIEPGKTGAGLAGAVFFVVDQADSVLAALGLAWAFFPLEGRVVLAGTVALTLLHLAINAALYATRVRRNL